MTRSNGFQFIKSIDIEECLKTYVTNNEIRYRNLSDDDEAKIGYNKLVELRLEGINDEDGAFSPRGGNSKRFNMKAVNINY